MSKSIASMAMPVSAATLRTTSTKSAAADASSGGDPGSVLYGYFDSHEPPSNNGTGNGGTAVNLINTTAQDMCALVYIFDNDEELLACCGCPRTANQLVSFGNNTRFLPREAGANLDSGVIAILGATALAPCSFNGSASNSSTPNFAGRSARWRETIRSCGLIRSSLVRAIACGSIFCHTSLDGFCCRSH